MGVVYTDPSQVTPPVKPIVLQFSLPTPVKRVLIIPKGLVVSAPEAFRFFGIAL